jgi:hypothetical protein
MAGFFAYVGRLMENTSSRAARMILFPSGLLQIRPLLPVVKDINRGSQLYALIHGGAMIEIIDSAVWVKIVGSYYGTSASECCIGRKR